MTNNESVFDDLTTLRILFHLRKNVQNYSNGDRTTDTKNHILDAFNIITNSNSNKQQKIDDVILGFIKEKITSVSFNPNAYKKEETQEDKKAKSANKNNKEHNDKINKIKEQIFQEIAFSKSQGKLVDIPDRPEIVSITLSGDEKKFLVYIGDNKDPISLPLFVKGARKFSRTGYAEMAKGKKIASGLNTSTYDEIKKSKNGLLELATRDVIGKTNKEFTLSEYKKFLGLKASQKLNEQQQNELNILNSLNSKEEQNNFVSGLIDYVETCKKNNDLLNDIKAVSDKYEFLKSPDKLKKILEKYNYEDFSTEIQEKFISSLIANDKCPIWQNFSQKDSDNNEYYSSYEKLLLRTISNNKSIFEAAMTFENNNEMKKNIVEAFSKIKKLKQPVLTDDLCAEIFTLGIFKEGIGKGTNDEKIKKMNLILNEFGLNVASHPLDVVKAPDASIENAASQSAIDRKNFEESKKENIASAKEFDKFLKNQNIYRPASNEIHHYYALRYNAFVEQNLNNVSNYVRVAKQHKWNICGHDLTHRFDVSGEFLIRNETGNYSLMNFNTLRKAFNNGNKLQIMALSLQTKSDGKGFSDLLKTSDKPSKMGQYVSTDKTDAKIISVPDYCKKEAKKETTLSLIIKTMNGIGSK